VLAALAVAALAVVALAVVAIAVASVDMECNAAVTCWQGASATRGLVGIC